MSNPGYPPSAPHQYYPYQFQSHQQQDEQPYGYRGAPQPSTATYEGYPPALYPDQQPQWSSNPPPVYYTEQQYYPPPGSLPHSNQEAFYPSETAPPSSYFPYPPQPQPPSSQPRTDNSLPSPVLTPDTVNPTLLIQPQAEASRPTIKLKFSSSGAPASHSPADMSSSRRSQTFVKTEEAFSASGRPIRGARLAAEQSLSRIRDDSDPEDEAFMEDGEEAVPAASAIPSRRSQRGNAGRPSAKYEDDDFDDDEIRATSSRRPNTRRRVVDPDDEDAEGEASTGAEPPRRRAFPARTTRQSDASLNGNHVSPVDPSETRRTSLPTKLKTKQSRHSSADAESFEPSASDDTQEEDVSDDPLQDQWGTPDDDDDDYSRSVSPRRPRKKTRSTVRSAPTRRSTRNSRRAADSDEEYGAPKRKLRERTSKPNYQLPPLDISAELVQDTIASAAGPSRRRGVGFAGGTRFGADANSAGLPWGVRGKDLARAMGDPDTSDSDLDLATGMQGGGGPAALGAGGVGARPGQPSDVPNFGRINPKSNLADADPLGVNMDVTFDDVGGLDGHINQLKEMVALPLLYPEVFQQFGITPPRGVLFHGPPGTGKTLLARALAASCSTGNTKIAFFMRKGADVLSKWVGEAERQLRMLFEEARAAQPSIIFFDEIDGLAPVRSSKQDQIHASLVSTLLALMDGMDGRGQVIIIGATNRPDAVDSALRRPGRFDREFYFPLPNGEARRKIIKINTKKWSPPLAEETLDHLALLTKGYGGADLRALCTEAALNAIQRRYPQIYRTSDRLLLDHGSIHVQAKDFMLSVNKITPSSARSTSSVAAQLPEHLVPLLASSLGRLKSAVDLVLPRHKLTTALEEAEFVDEIGDDLEKHMLVQSLDKMRIYRPRVIMYGAAGMGQGYLGPAILHHLEGFHVQTLDLGTLMADSTRTPEATLVQLFVEAKRHQPSILFIPSLLSWASALSDTTRTIFQSLLDGIPSSDPVLLLAMADEPFIDLPRDIRSWFGVGKEGRVEVSNPSSDERAAYFSTLIDTFRRTPADFPDALPRRKRLLEILPPAPPLPPRAPTEVELQRELDRDLRARDMMVLSFTSLVQEFLKKFRKVAAGVKNDAFMVTTLLEQEAAAKPAAANLPEVRVAEAEDVPQHDSLPNGHLPVPADIPMPSSSAPASLENPQPAVAPVEPEAVWQAHDVDIDTLHRKLMRHKYHTPAEFLADVAKIEDNAAHIGDADRQARVAEMTANARLHVTQFDPKWMPEFERYKERMRVRKEDREKEKAKATGQTAAAEGADGATGEVAHTQAGANGILKRSHDGEGDEEREGKRPREMEMDIDPPVAVPSEEQQATIPILGSTVPDIASIMPTSVPEPRSASIQPTEPHPPFVLSSELLNSFAAELKVGTTSLNVDELEQVRAGCFDRLWRRRASWDRTGVVEECINWVRSFVKDVEEFKRDE